MFIYSIKLTKLRMLILAVVVLLLVATVVGGLKKEKKVDLPPKIVETVNLKKEKISLEGDSDERRLKFLSFYGYECSEEPIEIVEVIIPPVFDGVYDLYNETQKEGGFDLEKYKGKRIKRYTYEVKNYDESSDRVVANIMVYDKKIIGGDVCSLALGGFMHTFKR